MFRSTFRPVAVVAIMSQLALASAVRPAAAASPGTRTAAPASARAGSAANALRSGLAADVSRRTDVRDLGHAAATTPISIYQKWDCTTLYCGNHGAVN